MDWRKLWQQWGWVVKAVIVPVSVALYFSEGTIEGSRREINETLFSKIGDLAKGENSYSQTFHEQGGKSFLILIDSVANDTIIITSTCQEVSRDSATVSVLYTDLRFRSYITGLNFPATFDGTKWTVAVDSSILMSTLSWFHRSSVECRKEILKSWSRKFSESQLASEVIDGKALLVRESLSEDTVFLASIDYVRWIWDIPDTTFQVELSGHTNGPPLTIRIFVWRKEGIWVIPDLTTVRPAATFDSST